MNPERNILDQTREKMARDRWKFFHGLNTRPKPQEDTPSEFPLETTKRGRKRLFEQAVQDPDHIRLGEATKPVRNIFGRIRMVNGLYRSSIVVPYVDPRDRTGRQVVKGIIITDEENEAGRKLKRIANKTEKVMVAFRDRSGKQVVDDQGRNVFFLETRSVGIEKKPDSSVSRFVRGMREMLRRRPWPERIKKAQAIERGLKEQAEEVLTLSERKGVGKDKMKELQKNPFTKRTGLWEALLGSGHWGNRVVIKGNETTFYLPLGDNNGWTIDTKDLSPKGGKYEVQVNIPTIVDNVVNFFSQVFNKYIEAPFGVVNIIGSGADIKRATIGSRKPWDFQRKIQDIGKHARWSEQSVPTHIVETPSASDLLPIED